MSHPESFSLGTVLSITTGVLLAEVGELYRILSFMSGEDVFTHQLPRVADECKGPLLEQYPHLAGVVVPPVHGEDEVKAWLAIAESEFGETFDVLPLADGEHTAIDPLAELAMNFPHLRVIPVVLDGD